MSEYPCFIPAIIVRLVYVRIFSGINLTAKTKFFLSLSFAWLAGRLTGYIVVASRYVWHIGGGGGGVGKAFASTRKKRDVSFNLSSLVSSISRDHRTTNKVRTYCTYYCHFCGEKQLIKPF